MTHLQLIRRYSTAEAKLASYDFATTTALERADESAVTPTLQSTYHSDGPHPLDDRLAAEPPLLRSCIMLSMLVKPLWNDVMGKTPEPALVFSTSTARIGQNDFNTTSTWSCLTSVSIREPF